MKRRFVIGLFVLLALAACHRPVETQNFASLPHTSLELSAIDSLMWQRPDSALACLLPCFDTCCAVEYDRHYAHLLLSELLYKNDYAQTNRAELQDAVVYFDSLMQAPEPVEGPSKKRNAFLAARAHYINGVGYYEQDSAVPACQEYLKALETMEEGFEERELVGEKARFMALTYTHLSLLFSDYYLHEQVVYFGKNTLDYYQKYDATPWHVAWMLDEIGAQYEMMKLYDSANYYFCNSLKVLPDTNSLLYRDITTHLAFLLYQQRGEKNIALNQLSSILIQAEDDTEYLARCLAIGEIYFHEKQFDSAQIYLCKVFDDSENIEIKKQAAEWLVDICKNQGRDSEILKYADFLVPFANLSENESLIKSQLTTLCQYFEQNRLQIIHRKQLQKYNEYGGLLLLILFTLAFVFVTFHFIDKKRQIKLKSQKEAAEKRLESERYEHEIRQKALAGKLKRSNEALRQTTRQLEEANVPNNVVSDNCNTSSDLAAFKDSSICIHIIDVVEDCNFKPKIDCFIYKHYALDRSQQKALVEAANIHLNNFTFRIRKRHPALTDDDMKYCCLYLLGLNEADISALMQRAYSTVCERNRKIKRILGTERDLTIALMEWV